MNGGILIVPADGPAAAAPDLVCQRAPEFLRIVHKEADFHVRKGWDVLDQLDDEPDPEEKIYVYRRRMGPGFACRGPNAGVFATYEHVPDIDGESVRDTEAWRATVEDLAAKVAA